MDAVSGSIERNELMENAENSGKFLSFIIGHEEYAIAILAVREIMKVLEITAIPKVPAYIKGVINLRGVVIPIMDLRLKFGIPPKPFDNETCIIVVNLHNHLMGIVVDTVSEVLDIRHGDIEKSPDFGKNVKTDFIHGIGKVKGKVVIILDMDNILEGKEVAAIGMSVNTTNVKEESLYVSKS